VGHEPKPVLQRLFEEAAVAMDLDHGPHRLELTFVDGHLVSWGTHAEEHAAAALGLYEERLGSIVEELAGAALEG
jgi:hypothetical protein